MHTIHVHAVFSKSVQECFSIIKVSSGRDHDYFVTCGNVVSQLAYHGRNGPGIGKEFLGVSKCTKVKFFTGL